MSLEADQYVRLNFDQRLLDVAVRLLGPAGETIASVDGAGGRKEPERLSLVTAIGGQYRLVVTPHDSKLASGSYMVTLEELRPARQEDADRVRAEASLSEADHLQVGEEPTDLVRALAAAREALSLWKRIHDPEGEIRTLLTLGNVYFSNAEDPKAFEVLREALSLSLEAHDLRGEARSRRMLGSFDESLDGGIRIGYLQRSLEIWQELGDVEGQANALYSKGRFEFDSAKFSEALISFRQALDLAQAAGARSFEADIWNGIGAIHSGRGESEEALQCFEHALRLAREEENRGAEAAIFTSIGNLHRRRGELQEALTQFLAALELNKKYGDPTDRGVVLIHLGSIYMDLGDTDQALKCYEEALGLFRSGGVKGWESVTLVNIGHLYLSLKEWQSALENFEHARTLSIETKNRKRLATALHSAGVARLNLGQHEAAIRALEEALPTRKDIGDRLGEAATLLQLGKTYRDQGDPERAVSLLNEALSIARQAEASFVQAEALFNLARLERDRGNLQESLANIEKSLGILESARLSLATDRLKSFFFASRRSYYDFYVDLLLRLDGGHPGQGYQARALDASEQARARSLLDLLTEGRLNLTRGISPELKRKETDVNARLSQIQGELMDELSRERPIQEKIANLHTRLDEVEGERQALEVRIRNEHPRYAGVRYSSPLKLKEIQERLKENWALLEYSLGEESSYLFVVTVDRLEVHQLPGSQRIADEVRAVRTGIERPGRRSASMYARAAYRLYKDLIAPARSALAGKRNLLISPDGPLHFLSFEVLLTEEDRGREFADLPYLLRDFSVTYIPSASVLSWLSAPPAAPEGGEAGKLFLAFADPIYGPEDGDKRTAGQPTRGAGAESGAPLQERGLGPMPRLEGTAREVKAIAGLYPVEEVQLYERDQATEENVKNNPLIEKARRIHFATHGVLNERQPELSGLRLTRTTHPGDDGLLQVHEIFDLNLQAELVVLSACDTGRGKEVTGEGLIGVTRAFLYAGTPSLVVSLWQVVDAQAPDLMLSFYKGLDLTGDKTEALRQAKLGMIREKSYARPYYWAPFVLVGKP